MLLTITTTHRPATDLGFLLHKHPDRFQSFSLAFGKAHVFYPEAADERCTACLLLDVNPVDLVRGKGGASQRRSLFQDYVNDRPYVASSLMSVAIAQTLRTALKGECKDRPDLAASPIPLEARIDVLPARGGDDFLHRLFEPLGYEVETNRYPLDSRFSDWGDSPYHSVALRATKRLSELLTHLYVLIPVFDNDKHYYVGTDELEKLLARGEGWLADHPEKPQIVRRYLKHRSSLFRQALARLVEAETGETLDDSRLVDRQEAALERPLSLHQQRHGAVLAALKSSGASSVVDLGCGEGKLLRELLNDRQFERILGMDVSMQSLERARDRLKLDRLSERQSKRISLIQGSLLYRDQRLAGFDAATVIEVIEHLDPPRLSALERVVFEFARPPTVIVTTPNREYNVMWETLPAGEFRHRDHRFEWTRDEFRQWATRIDDTYGYQTRFLPIGPEDPRVGSPTQMAVFQRTARRV